MYRSVYTYMLHQCKCVCIIIYIYTHNEVCVDKHILQILYDSTPCGTELLTIQFPIAYTRTRLG